MYYESKVMLEGMFGIGENVRRNAGAEALESWHWWDGKNSMFTYR